jgi:DNA adenine methylase
VRAEGPIVKWVGGKTKLLPELVARMPKKYDRYFEPFAGGAALFFRLGPTAACLGDTNEALIDTYRAVVARVDGIIAWLEEHKQRHSNEGYYYEIREAWNEGWLDEDSARRAAAFIYLNKTCFNGLWRVNKKGEFNVPRGEYANPSIYNETQMRAASKLLQGVALQWGHYMSTANAALMGDFVYFDPPYDPVSKTSNFTSYTKDTFGKEQQAQLALYARDLATRGVHVMLSNNDTAFVRDLYKGFCIDNVKCGRSINSKGDKRGKVDEVIITSYERTS